MVRLAKRKAQQKLENKDQSARERILDEFFYDLHRRKGVIYRTNFVRGIFFGLGSALGGTIVLALIIAGLTLLIQIPGGIGDFMKWVVDAVSKS